MAFPRKKVAEKAATLAQVTSLTPRLVSRRRERGDYRIFILAYHDIAAEGDEPEGTINASRLEEQLHYVAANYRIASVSDCVDAIRSSKPLKEDLVGITFDDGYAGNYEHAFPVLERLGVPATIFLTTGFLDGGEFWFDIARRVIAFESEHPARVPVEIKRRLDELAASTSLPRDTPRVLAALKSESQAGRSEFIGACQNAELPISPGYRPLSWDQVREMARSTIAFGGHTVNHPILSSLSKAEQRDEIFDCARRMTEEIGDAPTLFAYPNGGVRDYNAVTVAALHDAGFKAAFTTARGSSRPGDSLFDIKRTSIGADSVDLIAGRLAGLFDESVRSWLPESMRHAN